MWFGRKKKKMPRKITPFFMEYDGNKGYAQIKGEVKKREKVAISVDTESGKIWRIMKVTRADPYSDFGGRCTDFDFIRTDDEYIKQGFTEEQALILCT